MSLLHAFRDYPGDEAQQPAHYHAASPAASGGAGHGAGPAPLKPLSPEQGAFVETPRARTDVVTVIAVAGSGKTTTLVAAGRAHALVLSAEAAAATAAAAAAGQQPPPVFVRRILYIVYSKEAQTHAERVMPAEAVEPRTFHSLALMILTHVRASKRQPPPGKPLNYVKLDIFKQAVCDDATTTPEQRTLMSAARGGAATFALAFFMRFLDDTQRTLTDAAYARAQLSAMVLAGKQLPASGAAAVAPPSPAEIARYVADNLPPAFARSLDAAAAFCMHAARVAWRCMCSGERNMPITFSGATKFMFLNGPDVSQRYAQVFVDEAQDLSRQYFETIMAWRNKLPLVFVGDPAQRIFSFNGSINVFAQEDLAPTRRHALTHSFRFGEPVAALLRGLTQAPVVGAATAPCRVVVATVPRKLSAAHAFGCAGAVAYLHRTNVDMLLHAVNVADASPTTRLAVKGRGEALLTRITELATLCTTTRWQFNKRLEEAAEDGDDAQVKMLEWIAEAPQQAATIARKLASRVTRGGGGGGGDGNVDNAEAVFSTAHGAKGLEWGACVVGDDFLPPTSFEVRARRTRGRAAAGAPAPARSRKRGIAGLSTSYDAAAIAPAAAPQLERQYKLVSEAAAAALLDHAHPLPSGAALLALEEEAPPRTRSYFAPIDECEATRLLYVALSRAKRLLVLSPDVYAHVVKRAAFFERMRNGAAAAAASTTTTTTTAATTTTTSAATTTTTTAATTTTTASTGVSSSDEDDAVLEYELQCIQRGKRNLASEQR